MLFIDFRFARMVEANPIYEADVTIGEVTDTINNGDLVLARFPLVVTSGPNTRTIGYVTTTEVYYTQSGPDTWKLNIYSPQAGGFYVTDSDLSAAADKVVVYLASQGGM